VSGEEEKRRVEIRRRRRFEWVLDDFLNFFWLLRSTGMGKGGRRRKPALSTEDRLWLVKLEFFVDERRREGNSSRLVAFAL
jgi:hypothetical protein